MRDVNGTPYHLLLGEGDWLPLLEADNRGELAWDPDSASVGLAPRLPRVQRGAELPLAPEDRRGAGRDRYGTWYWIDDDRRRVRVAPASDNRVGTFWDSAGREGDCQVSSSGCACAGSVPGDFAAGDFAACPPSPPGLGLELQGLAVTTYHYLVVGTLAPEPSETPDPAAEPGGATNGGLLIFDLHGGGPPTAVCWPDEVPFSPFDFAPAADGGVWVLDRDEVTGAGRYWKLDHLFRVVDLAGTVEVSPATQSDFKPVDGEAPVTEAALFPLAVDLSLASPVDAEAPVAILELPDGSVLLLDNPPGQTFSLVHRHRDGAALGDPVSLQGALAPILDPASTADPDLLAHDFAFLPAAGGGDSGAISGGAPAPLGGLFFVPVDSDQAFAFALGIDPDTDAFGLAVCPRYLPMRSYDGRALVAACGDVYYDFGERWLPLGEHPRRRFAPDGGVQGIVFDGRQPGCRWHRLFLDGCIPDGTGVTIETRAADDPALLAQAPWHAEPRPYLRATGSELPFHRPGGDGSGSSTVAGTWELLVQRAEGRYVELRLTLASDGRSTPRLHALRLYYPRFSYLHEYLPAVYRADDDSALFLDRFLANVEGLFTELEGEVAAAQMLFDVRTAPPEFLDWLAGWLGAGLDPLWDDHRRRLFLAHAPLLFRWRGTVHGLLAALRVALDPCPGEWIFDQLEAATDGSDGCAGGDCAFAGLRLVEAFQARRLPATALGDPTTLEGPGLSAGDAPWEPSQGAAGLHQLYAEFLERRYCQPGDDDAGSAALAAWNAAWGSGFTAFSEVRLSPVTPADPARAEDWRAFVRDGLPFPYAAVTAADTGLWREFLAQRHSTVAALNAAWRLAGGLAHAAFSAVPLPAENDFPDGGQRLVDWIDFVSLVLPIRDSAHRFTVLVPTEPGEDLGRRDTRLAAVRDLVEREKPTHTSFDVKPYWALFQVGGARLGLDTVLGEGSRFVAVVLGSTYLGQGFLAESHPWNVDHRPLVGRDIPMEM